MYKGVYKVKNKSLGCLEEESGIYINASIRNKWPDQQANKIVARSMNRM
jgi:hypothetical protein